MSELSLCQDYSQHACCISETELYLKQGDPWEMRQQVDSSQVFYTVQVHRYRLHYIAIPLSARIEIAPRGVTEHVFIVIKVMIIQCLSLRNTISNHSRVILNQIETLCQVNVGRIKMCSVSLDLLWSGWHGGERPTGWEMPDTEPTCSRSKNKKNIT